MYCANGNILSRRVIAQSRLLCPRDLPSVRSGKPSKFNEEPSHLISQLHSFSTKSIISSLRNYDVPARNLFQRTLQTVSSKSGFCPGFLN